MVKWVKISEIADVGTGSGNRQDENENGKYPFYVRSQIVLRNDNYEFDEEAIVIPGEGGIGDIFHYVVGKYALHQRAYRIHITSSNVLTKYVYYYFTIFFKLYILGKSLNAAVSSIRKPMLLDFEIPLPSLSEQQRIVDILDKFEGMVENVEKELLLRQKQYEVYREKVIFSIPIIRKVCKLSEIAEICTGSCNTCDGINDGKYLFYTRGQEVLTMNEYEFDDQSIITSGDGVGVGKVFHLTNGKYALHQRAYRIHITDKKVSTKYVYYYFITCFYDYICMKSFFASVSSLRKPMLLDFEIPLPYLDKQQEIVAKLDKFEEMISTLKRELELRKKQYEYYREKLLTFE